MKLFGREPSAWAGLLQGVLAAVLALGLFNLTSEQTALAQAASAAVFALVTAFLTKSASASVVVSAAQAVLALLVGFGLSLTPETTAALIGAVQLVSAFWLRQQTSPAEQPSFHDEPPVAPDPELL